MVAQLFIGIGILTAVGLLAWYIFCNEFPISDSKFYSCNWNWVKKIQKKYDDRVDKWMEYERTKK